MASSPINLIPVQYYYPNTNMQSCFQPLSGIQTPLLTNDMYVPNPALTNSRPLLINAILVPIIPVISWFNPLKIEKPTSSSVFKIEPAPPYEPFARKIDSIPDINKIDISNNWVFDARGSDLTRFDLSDKKELLRYADFDSNTKWPSPDKMPKDFNPQEVLENNKNPGLGVRQMHEKGYTGKGVTVAIIDQLLGTNHKEFKDRVVNYQNIGYPQDVPAQMHGSAVTSILAGRTVGVAPDSKVVYFAASNEPFDEDEKHCPNKNFTQALKRIIEMNRSLPDDQKISAVSISWGFNDKSPDYPELLDTIKKAQDSGIFVVSCMLHKTDNLDFQGLYRDPQCNPDDPKSYKAGLWWAKDEDKEGKEDLLLFPMDHRTTASFTDDNSYAHYNNGGWSWVVPYITGMYAVAKQIKPSITPQEFWKKALETGTPLLSKTGKITGKIINPLKLTENLEQK